MNVDLFPDELPAWDGEGADPLERYWTPEHAVHALMKHAGDIITGVVWEPCAGAQHISTVLKEYDQIGLVFESDISPVGPPPPGVAQVGAYPRLDFLSVGEHCKVIDRSVDWIVTNTPFSNAADFLRVALNVAQAGVALLLPLNFWEGTKDRRDLLREHPPTRCIHLGRFNFIMPRPGTGPSKEHMWFVWHFDSHHPGLTRHVYHTKGIST